MKPQVIWISGSSCDFLMSLFVLYRATTFGIRPAWAAGVRQRLSSRSRETLESIFSFSSLPLAWLSRLPAPRAAQTVLEAAQQIPAAERLPMLTLPTGLAPSGEEVLQRVAEKRRWSEEDKEQLVSAYGRLPTPPSKGIETMLTCWTDLETWGERYLLALQEYHRVFFQEEEAHLVPLLESALRESQRLAETLSPFDLLERLSRGVRLQDEGQIEQLILFPSWWVHPLVFLGYKENLAFVVFSARWHVAQPLSFEPPEELIQVFKALGDSTRLRILRYLSGRPLTPSELARRLRLRLPTILHHLQILRLAGLVQVMIGKDYEKRYALRVEALEETDRSLKSFLASHD